MTLILVWALGILGGWFARSAMFHHNRARAYDLIQPSSEHPEYLQGFLDAMDYSDGKYK